MMTDPIADMLTRIRNANTALHDQVEMPASGLKTQVAGVLKDQGYISDFELRDGRVGQDLVIRLKYSSDRRRVISGLERVSKPGLRVYAKADSLPRVLGGLGVAVVSTSNGLMTDREARKSRMGGEVLCFVW